jgi:hypothetical protein
MYYCTLVRPYMAMLVIDRCMLVDFMYFANTNTRGGRNCDCLICSRSFRRLIELNYVQFSLGVERPECRSITLCPAPASSGKVW